MWYLFDEEFYWYWDLWRFIFTVELGKCSWQKRFSPKAMINTFYHHLQSLYESLFFSLYWIHKCSKTLRTYLLYKLLHLSNYVVKEESFCSSTVIRNHTLKCEEFILNAQCQLHLFCKTWLHPDYPWNNFSICNGEIFFLKKETQKNTFSSYRSEFHILSFNLK